MLGALVTACCGNETSYLELNYGRGVALIALLRELLHGHVASSSATVGHGLHSLSKPDNSDAASIRVR